MKASTHPNFSQPKKASHAQCYNAHPRPAKKSSMNPQSIIPTATSESSAAEALASILLLSKRIKEVRLQMIALDLESYFDKRPHIARIAVSGSTKNASLWPGQPSNTPTTPRTTIHSFSTRTTSSTSSNHTGHLHLCSTPDKASAEPARPALPSWAFRPTAHGWPRERPLPSPHPHCHKHAHSAFELRNTPFKSTLRAAFHVLTARPAPLLPKPYAPTQSATSLENFSALSPALHFFR